MPHKILDYEVKYRPIKYPRIELRTGRIVVILPEGHDTNKVLQKHEKWIKDKLNIIAEIITDAGHTEVPPGTVTCIGIGPAEEHVIDAVTGKLQLY